MKKIIKETAAIILAVVLLISAANLAAFALMPVRTDYGSVWEKFKKEPKNSIDVLVLGSSIVYCDLIPSKIYEKTGITSFLCAGPEQTMSLGYYALNEALKTQNPSAVVLELSGMFFKKYQNYTSVNIDYMPWGTARLGAIFSAAQPDLRRSLLFPIFSYHDRWYKVPVNEVTPHFTPEADKTAGYTVLKNAEPQSEIQYLEVGTESEGYTAALEYLKKISALCEKEGIELILYTAPSFRRVPDEASLDMEKDLESIPHAVYRDFNAEIESLGIDDSSDWFDLLHFNLYGAVKFSEEFAYFLESSGVSPAGKEDKALWAERSEYIQLLLTEK